MSPVNFCPQKTWRAGVCITDNPGLDFLGFPWISLVLIETFQWVRSLKGEFFSALFRALRGVGTPAVEAMRKRRTVFIGRA